MADYTEQIAQALRDYVPPAPESSEGFPPLLDKPDRRVVKLRDYRPVATPSIRLNGEMAKEMAENDAALDGFKLVSASETEAVFELDSELAGRAQLRKEYSRYTAQWSHAAALAQVRGAPLSPMAFVAKIAAGEPLFEPPDVPKPISAEEARLRKIEEKLARVPIATLPG
jgi:hypothetical protein